jgi:sRNA-binding protein
MVDKVRKPREQGPSVLPVLEKLFECYPALFGAEFLPLKLGVFHEILAQHPDKFDKESLKAALGVHTRSTRYLQSVAAGKTRHDLTGTAVEPLAPEHIYLAIMELYRRRQGRSKVDLKPQLLTQLTQAFEASGLGREEYAALVHVNLAEANASLCEAFAVLDAVLAKDTALLRAYQQSGKTPGEFADMYGLSLADVQRALALA